MSRPLRIQYPGAWYHVMNRGLNKCHIFHESKHQQKFLTLLKDIHSRYKVQIHAYCLMDNHYHLILHTPESNLSRAIRHVDGVYTQYFNHDMKRDGALFRGRYKSILIDAENYLLLLSRYIHLNPVDAKLCTKPEEYEWSSYSLYLQSIKCPDWLYCDEVLLRCSETLSIESYREFVEEGIDANIAQIYSKTQLPSVLGAKDWVETIKKQHVTIKQVDNREIPAAKQLMNANKIKTLMQKIAAYYDIPTESLKNRGHKYSANLPRNLFIYIAVSLGWEYKAIAMELGNITAAGVSSLIKQLNDKLICQLSLKNEVKRLKKYLLITDFET
jgi:putative transposase